MQTSNKPRQELASFMGGKSKGLLIYDRCGGRKARTVYYEPSKAYHDHMKVLNISALAIKNRKHPPEAIYCTPLERILRRVSMLFKYMSIKPSYFLKDSWLKDPPQRRQLSTVDVKDVEANWNDLTLE